MSPMFVLALRSIGTRRLSVALTVIAVALSVALLLGVERLRNDAREGFAQTISGTDLVVGARGGALQLLLYAVFHIGNASNNVSWPSIQHIAALPQVKWLVPISLGDSHRGMRVVGTTAEFFTHYRHGDRRTLGFAAGRAFAAYGGVYICASLVWMALVEKTTPDRWDVLGGAVCLIGAGIILFGPRAA